jgi:hypothetical protein
MERICNMKTSYSEKSLSDNDDRCYSLWQVDRRVSYRTRCVYQNTRTLLFAGLTVSRTTALDLGET